MKRIFHDITLILNNKERKQFRLLALLNTLISIGDIGSFVVLLFIVKLYTQPSAGFELGTYAINRNSIAPIVLLILLFALKNIFGHIVYKTQARFISDIAVRLSKKGLTDYLNGPYTNYANTDSAVYTRKIIHQPTEFAQYVLLSVQQIIIEVILILLSIIALLIYNGSLFIIIAITLLPAIAILTYLNKRRLAHLKKNIKTSVEQSLQYLNESLTGFIESNIYHKNEFFINRHSDIQKTIGAYIANIQVTQDLPTRFFEVFSVLGLFMLIIASKFNGSAETINVVLIGAFIAAAYKITPGISKIIRLNSQVTAYQHVVAELAEESPIHINHKKTSAGTTKSITFNNVSFAYNEIPVLSNFHCTIHSGSLTGLSGYSGRGKTTLLHLILGFLSPVEGNISFDNEQKDLSWRSVAYVKQEAFIIHSSILNNIVLFEDNYDTIRLGDILQITGVDVIASSFSAGIHHQIMQDGKDISGGQRQRISIARALYKNADVILLDEPFSELDSESEIKLLQYFKELAATGKIVVFITHNKESLSYCDAIIDL